MVSTPVEWKEVESALKKKDPELLRFDYEHVLRRVKRKGDLFASVLDETQKLPRAEAISKS